MQSKISFNSQLAISFTTSSIVPFVLLILFSKAFTAAALTLFILMIISIVISVLFIRRSMAKSIGVIALKLTQESQSIVRESTDITHLSEKLAENTAVQSNNIGSTTRIDLIDDQNHRR